LTYFLRNLAELSCFSRLECRLVGNPLCSNTITQFGERCNQTNPTIIWQAPANASCGNTVCNQNKELNHKTCNCSYPFHLTVDITSPTFSNLSEPLAATIETEIANQFTSKRFLTLDPSQVVINQGFSRPDLRYTLELLFFPLVGDSLSTANTTEITTIFNQRMIMIQEGPFQVPGAPYTRKCCLPFPCLIQRSKTIN
jgi:hypothetical protein